MPPGKKAFSEAQQKVELEASVSETEIIFPEKDDMIFMGQNIFGHDFIHDFNSATMGERLKKIEENITALTSFSVGGSIYRGGDADTEIVNLDNYMLNIPDLEKFNQFSDKITQFNRRPNTRRKVKILQDIDSLLQEMELYKVGFIHSTDVYEESPRSSGGAAAVEPKLGVNQFKFYSDAIRKGFRLVINNPDNKSLRHVYIAMFRLYLFLENPAIHPYKILNNTLIHKAMTVYLLDPDAFNSSKEVYQLLHTLALSYSKKPGKKTGSRSSRRNQGGMKGGDGVLLNENLLRSILTAMENSSDNVYLLLQYALIGTPETRSNVLSVIKSGDVYTDVFEKKIAQYEQVFSRINGYNIPELRNVYRVIQIINRDLPTMLEQVVRSRNALNNRNVFGVRRLAKEAIYVGALSNVIINFIYEPLKAALYEFEALQGFLLLSELPAEIAPVVVPEQPAAVESQPQLEQAPVQPAAVEAQPPLVPVPAEAAVAPAAAKIEEVENILTEEVAKRLSKEDSNTVQQISVCVAKGVLKYIGRAVPTNTHFMLKSETKILENIANKHGFTSVDSDIIKAFDKYIDKPSEYAAKINHANISNVVQRIPDKKSINNAANKPMMEELGLKSTIICPNSSILDAMGTFGSCSGSKLPREKYSMGFRLTNEDGINYYSGKSIYKDDKVKIIYSANINGLALPHVEKVVDIKSTNYITVLSANNTFKSILDKIRTIWMGIGMENRNATHNMYWERLFQNETLFTQLVSVGSLKSVGDLFQEINSTALNGSYTLDAATANIINRQLRIGIMGDRPSGVRAGFILYKAISGVHPKSIAGYFAQKDTSTVAVSRPAAELMGIEIAQPVKFEVAEPVKFAIGKPPTVESATKKPAATKSAAAAKTKKTVSKRASKKATASATATSNKEVLPASKKATTKRKRSETGPEAAPPSKRAYTKKTTKK